MRPIPLPDAFSSPGLLALLDLLHFLPDTVAFIKDDQGRYVYGNDTLLRRLHLRSPEALTGRQASDLFPAALGDRYTQQDLKVLAGKPLTEHLERHLYTGGRSGWCLTTKRAVHDPGGATLGLIGISRDLAMSPGSGTALADAVAHIQEHYARPLSIADLAARNQMSLVTFERQIKRVYGVTPSQLLMRARVEAATRLLQTTAWPVARVAVECGYFDHSAFSRVFKAAVGVTPRQFRELFPPEPATPSKVRR
ncbi:AraC family transcriptional regulator [Deinococcus radiotolerans]|uniref:Transcriptional regulator n=1 Tax=Deinococcus radiotolerans TaxID=1309407 RepID=A0ABQ2FM64_9DEIO|nr:AraC family transcriptional regulator [Deinococcus radiotolerans]GGL08275.1 transcriptional regulator [Deinococcus radiotolerans]